MNSDVIDQLVEILEKDFEEFAATAERLMDENPDATFAEIEAMIPHNELPIPEELKSFTEEYDKAVAIVTLRNFMAALGE